jgi:hypothetical protein
MLPPRPAAGTSQNEKDRFLTALRLKDFDPNRSAAHSLLAELFGQKINGTDLVSLAETCAVCLNLYLDREAKRRKPVLMKWFDENIDAIRPFLRDHVVIENSSRELLGSGRAIEKLRRKRQEARTDERRGEPAPKKLEG